MKMRATPKRWSLTEAGKASPAGWNASYAEAEEEPASGPQHSWSERWRVRLRRLNAPVLRALIFCSGIIATLIALLLYNALVPPPRQVTMREVNESVAQALASATPQPPFAERVYQTIQPSLVLIEAQSLNAAGKSERGLGAGVIVNEQGAILTALHVVTEATEIRLTFADGTESLAEIATSQPEQDIAVLRAMNPPAKVLPATLGNPGAQRVGDEAFVVGNPFGLSSSMSAGVISGFDRSIQPVSSEYKLDNLIQVDAAANPGNSGGPLLNRYGEVIGIITGVMNPTDQNFFVGIAFAVPINATGSGTGVPPW